MTVLWDLQVKTDRHIFCNDIDRVVRDREINNCVLIDVVIPSDYNNSEANVLQSQRYINMWISSLSVRDLGNKKVEVVTLRDATGVVEETP